MIKGEWLEVEIVNEATGKTLYGYCMDVFDSMFLYDFLNKAFK